MAQQGAVEALEAVEGAVEGAAEEEQAIAAAEGTLGVAFELEVAIIASSTARE